MRRWATVAVLTPGVNNSAYYEHAFLAEICADLARQGHAVGLVTRTHFEAAVLAHALRKHNLNPASFARLIWEEPTPQVILSLLYLMLGQANNGHLHLVMLGFGVPPAAIAGRSRFSSDSRVSGPGKRSSTVPSAPMTKVSGTPEEPMASCTSEIRSLPMRR